MMSSKAILAALKWVVLWSIMAAFVALLTLIFSFLGAIFCAGLAGMMSGASRHSRWYTVPLAAVFPAVLWLVLRLSKAELAPHQVHLLMVVCFATFWFTYALGWGVVAYERKGRRTQAARPEQSAGAGKSPALQPANGTAALACTPGLGGAGATTCTAGLSLRQLQGTWCHDGAARNAPAEKELLEIEHNHLTLRAIGPDGQVRCALQGEFTVERATCMRGVVISAAADWPADLSVCI